MENVVEVIEAMKVMDRDYSGYRKQQAMDYAMERDMDTFDIHVLRGIAFAQILQEINDSKGQKTKAQSKSNQDSIEKEKRKAIFENLKQGDWIGVKNWQDGQHEVEYLCVSGIDSKSGAFGSFRGVHFYAHCELSLNSLIDSLHGETHYVGEGVERGWLGKKLFSVPYLPSRAMRAAKISNKNKPVLALEVAAAYSRHDKTIF